MNTHGKNVDVNKPVLGGGATICYWSDRHAATVIAISKGGHRITLQEDKATRTDANGMSESQSYTYERDPDGNIRTCTRHADGTYHLSGGRGRVLFNIRSQYYDYSF